MNNNEDEIFVRNFSLVLAGLLVIGLIAFILANVVTEKFAGASGDSEIIAERIAPVGAPNTSEAAIVFETSKNANAGAPKTPKESMAEVEDGKVVYDKVCTVCHAQGIAGAPKFADISAWSSRLAKGKQALYANAINGYMGDAGYMPAKGGDMKLHDDSVRAAVDYMLTSLEN
ncbi:MAG: cytochrome c5 family protein [Proteobacteria bacterium]|jgi:cytochrome c5|nr:cytochrome c5 family protein [Pseudomonadota bacterium]MBT6193356.1 cytochrome c5 family protein [Pseudomonadota bacterium]MBT6464789.1 cytochrome c5 family protein [Pseudomonadota bacterium]MBT6675270.1 cytochrome c5 family protein [Pseudomonadota bacterium]MBT7246682.1 cytochrome c5 family protein [Pseudomonadota bacterium]